MAQAVRGFYLSQIKREVRVCVVFDCCDDDAVVRQFLPSCSDCHSCSVCDPGRLTRVPFDLYPF